MKAFKSAHICSSIMPGSAGKMCIAKAKHASSFVYRFLSFFANIFLLPITSSDVMEQTYAGGCDELSTNEPPVAHTPHQIRYESWKLALSCNSIQFYRDKKLYCDSWQLFLSTRECKIETNRNEVLFTFK